MASVRLASEMEGVAGVDAKRQRADDGVDPHNAPPSKVLHVRGLPDGAQSSDLITALSVFGPVSYVVMMKNNKQALVEMKDVMTATNLVRASLATPVFVGGQRVFANFSKSQEIARDSVGPQGANTLDQKPTNILLMTVLNPLYPITTEVLHTICAPFGRVLRIVIFRKHGVQGMVEFETVDSAMRARDSLNNADVYAGCCTLKIEYSRAGKLNVRRNDENTFDYTQPNLGSGAQHPPFIGAQANMGMAGAVGGRGGAMGAMGGMGGPMGGPMGGMGGMGGPMGGMGGPMGGMGGPMGGPMAGMGGTGGGPVLMVYGLPADKMNCDRLFNLFCMYGNVAKIKFLPEKPGIAMVQMSDGYAADVAMQSLNGTPLFGGKLELQRSKHPYIAGGGQQQVKNLTDGTPATVEYGASKLNRFLRPDNKNRLYKPSTNVHFYNAPPGSTPESITQMSLEAGAPAPTSCKTFDKDVTRPSTGMLEYDSIEHAVEAAAILNHLRVPTGNGSDQICFKVAFAANKRAPGAPQ